MKNQFIDMMKSKIVVRVEGKSPERFILRLHKQKINITHIKKISKEKLELIIYYADYEKLLKLNTIYEIKVIKYLGIVNKRRQLLKYYHVLFIILLGIMLIYFLSKLIFSVDIITNDEAMKSRLTKTLSSFNIKKYHFQKNYNYIQKVKESILENYHDEIEWVEIKRVGTKYILRYEPRVIKEDVPSDKYRHIVAKKNAIIRNVYANSGQILKNRYAYVKKGDIIISGYIYLNEKIKDTVSSQGKVYGEVWYVTKVKYPFNYYEQKKTGKSKTVYTLKINNNVIELFNFHPFNDKIIKEDIILRHHFLPIQFTKQYQEEVEISSSMNVIEEVKLKAIDLAYEKIESSLKEGEYIINHHVLDSKIIDSGVEMQIFFSVCEDITDYEEIEEFNEEDIDNE